MEGVKNGILLFPAVSSKLAYGHFPLSVRKVGVCLIAERPTGFSFDGTFPNCLDDARIAKFAGF